MIVEQWTGLHAAPQTGDASRPVKQMAVIDGKRCFPSGILSILYGLAPLSVDQGLQRSASPVTTPPLMPPSFLEEIT